MTRQERAADLYRSGQSLAEVAVELGVAHSTVHRWLTLGGVPRRPATNLGARWAPAVDEVLGLYEAGFSLSEIADRTYLSRSAVYYRLKRAGVRMRPRGQHAGSDGRRGPSHAEKDRTVALYRLGLSTSEISELVGIRPSTVRRRLARAGEPRRPRSEALRLRFARRQKATRGDMTNEEIVK